MASMDIAYIAFGQRAIWSEHYMGRELWTVASLDGTRGLSV